MMGTNILARIATFLLCACALCCLGVGVREQPVVRTKTGQVAGQRITYNNTDLDVFYGIPYARPPLGDLRFLKPQPPLSWEGTLNATRKPTACRQIELVFSKNATFSYVNASENCLYVNVVKPSCSNSADCLEPLPVMVYIHGGAFQWGDSSLVFFDGRNFVATTGIILVTFNYRVGLFGFLSTETPELPGNMGLWDQNLALKWVKDNIIHFGGNPEEITLCGQSAGAISVGMHALSPRSKGLFKKIIMQSGTPLSTIMTHSYRGIGRLLSIAGLLGCYDKDKSWTEQISSMLDCLRTKEAGDIIATLRTQEYTHQIYVPVVGDDFLPEEPREMDPFIINANAVFSGTTLNEATVLVDNLRYISPGLFEALSGDYRIGVTLAITVLVGLTLSESKRITYSYYGGYDVEHSQQEVIDILAEIIGDVVFQCPTHYYLVAASKKGIDSYRYMFAHRSSYSLWPEWMGVTHADDIPYTFGSLPHIKDAIQNPTPNTVSLKGVFDIGNFSYSTTEEHFMNEILNIWKSFIVNGKPTIPLSSDKWPEYSLSNPSLVYLQPTNYSKGPAPRKDRCTLWKKYLLREQIQDGPSTERPSPPHKTKPTRKPKPARRPGKPLDNTVASNASTSFASIITFLASFIISVREISSSYSL
ncbi:acetylcholinesterase-1-like [Ornithodoros turicata]|uniref:acetylcholinesterase-1-like n=1 Tax=Ornithodoros turicata TaxID=34597 RepID=UPI0031398098